MISVQGLNTAKPTRLWRCPGSTQMYPWILQPCKRVGAQLPEEGISTVHWTGAALGSELGSQGSILSPGGRMQNQEARGLALLALNLVQPVTSMHTECNRWCSDPGVFCTQERPIGLTATGHWGPSGQNSWAACLVLRRRQISLFLHLCLSSYTYNCYLQSKRTQPASVPDKEESVQL